MNKFYMRPLAIACSRTVCTRSTGIRVFSQLKTRSSFKIITSLTCPTAVTTHSTPLHHCPTHPGGGAVPGTHTKTNQYSTHPGLRSSEELRSKVSRAIALFDLPCPHCRNRFAKRAVVGGSDEKAAHRLLKTKISADKELDIFSKYRSSRGLSECQQIFASRNHSKFYSFLRLRASILLNWISVCSLRTCFSNTDNNSLVVFEKRFATPIKFLLNETASKSANSKTLKGQQQIIFRSLQQHKRLVLFAFTVPHRISIRPLHRWSSPVMAKSKFEYVRQFETDDPCLPNCWVVVRIDGKAFHKFTDAHHYMKPNDERGLSLMTRAAQTVMSEFNEIVLAYGQSDEYSFVFHKNCKLYNRRASKIMTNVVSLFASSFTLYWSRFFNSQELQYPASFDGRVVLYPSDDNLRDYLSWRQADCHINNLYNTCFWKLVQEKGLTPNRAAERLKGTLSSDKNELLFSEFSINYNNLPELYRKGSVLIRPKNSFDDASPSPEKSVGNHVRGHDGKASKKPGSIVLHTDIIGKQFWEDNPHILNPKI